MRKSTLAFALFLSLPYSHIAYGQLSRDSIRFIIKRAIDNKRSPGMVVGVINDTGSYVFGYGKMNTNSNLQPNGNTLFEIGSVTKTFTTLLMADMVMKGEVNLSDPISKFLPKSVKTPTRNGKEITLLDLATHTSGLPMDPDDIDSSYSVEKLYDFISHYTLTRDIGSKYEYSNLGVGLLGHILSLVAYPQPPDGGEKGYETLVEQRICKPLNMTNTVITITPELKERLATGYNSFEQPEGALYLNSLDACGAIKSTVNDMLKFMAANMGLIQTNLAPAIKLTQIIHDTITNNFFVALGWHVSSEYGRSIYCHSGKTPGFVSFIGFDLKSKTGVVVLANSANEVNDIGSHILESKVPLHHIYGVNNIVSLPDSLLKKYAGVYITNDSSYRIITKKDKNLFYNTFAPYWRASKMYFTSDTSFFSYTYPTEPIIYSDSTGRVKGLRLKTGYVFAKRNDSLKLAFSYYNLLGWSALEDKDYTAALNYIQRGLKTDSTNLTLLGNLAHAYLFSGNYSKAIYLYKKYMGQSLNKNLSWEAMIKSDFATFKTDGLPAEPMERVLKELKIGN